MLVAIHKLRGRHGNLVAVDESVEPVGGRAAGGAEELIEAVMNGGIRDGLAVVDAFDRLETALVDRLAVFIEKGKANVPLAKHRCVIAL